MKKISFKFNKVKCSDRENTLVKRRLRELLVAAKQHAGGCELTLEQSSEGCGRSIVITAVGRDERQLTVNGVRGIRYFRRMPLEWVFLIPRRVVPRKFICFRLLCGDEGFFIMDEAINAGRANDAEGFSSIAKHTRNYFYWRRLF